MASPFSRTMRSLYADNFYVSLTGLIVAIVLAIAWGNWFFTAKVTFYETSPKVYVTDDEIVIRDFPENARNGGAQRALTTRRRKVIAEFPIATVEQIQPGQAAFLYLNTKIGKAAGAIPALVMHVIPDKRKGSVQVELSAEIRGDLPNPFEKGSGGEVKIETKQVTPVMLVMQASGLFTQTPPTSLSPQKQRNRAHSPGE